MKLVAAIDQLEDALARYFATRDIPLDIQQAVTAVEVALIEAGMSPLSTSGIAQRMPDPVQR